MQQNKNLPKTYKGYSTGELLEMYESIGKGGLKGRPKEMIRAMDDLLREHRIGGQFENQPTNPLANL
jgi:hypothetical protein